MSTLLASLQRIVERLFGRVFTALQAAPPGALQLTGVLGLAAVLVGYYHLRRNQTGRDDPAATRRHLQAPGARQQHQQGGGQQQVASQLQTGRKAQATSSPAAPPPPSTPLGQAVRAQLVGAKRVTIAAPGVLLQQWAAHDLQDAAELRPDAADTLREIAACADTYLLTHVVDDVGQAAVTGALEAAGLVGRGPGQVASHKLLFCSTLEGKTSLVRQLEPDLHIDGHGVTIEDLKRFMPQLLHVTAPGTAPAAPGAPNVVSAPSLAAFFGHVEQVQ